MLDKQFREAMGRFAGAVNAITTFEDDMPVGLIATAVCSLSAEPPSVIVCVNKSASAHNAMLNHGYFGLSLLSPAQAGIVSRFTERKGSDRFAEDEWDLQNNKAPILLDAPVGMVCKVANCFDGFSHTIFVGVIEAITLCDPEHNHCLLWKGRGLHQAVEYVAAH
ncbi:flavin reductase family protein [Pseudomonas alliivorans]|nr:flavin reductase family protein [Pseudomonas alliivorans]